MTGLLTLLRALLHRLGTSLVILVVALCAAAAATIGPTYYTAARSSILQDTMASENVIGRGLQGSQQGAVQGPLAGLESLVSGEMNRVLGGAAATRRLFQPVVAAVETRAFFAGRGENVPLVWRTDVCRHVRFHDGRCPTQPGEVVISTSLAAENGWRTGDRIQPAAQPPLVVSGVYVPPDPDEDYWFGRGNTYFPAEVPTDRSLPYDALFTVPATIENMRGNPQGTVLVSRVLAAPRVTPDDVDRLGQLDSRLNNSPRLANIAVSTGLAQTVETVHSSWSSLSVPVWVVTAELLVLTWLLLYLVVTDTVEARGTEVALAKLRGYSGMRALIFGLGEPALLLLLALPLGALLGRLVTGLLCDVLLRRDTRVELPALGWAGAAVAVAGGLAAITIAGRATLRRPVVEQWRRAGRRATDRSWVFDAVILTGTVAGLTQLAISGTLSSASTSPLALLVPGLLGLAIAVVCSRLLPFGCRLLYNRTRHSGGLGGFLAVRHIARRPGGTRTTMILATAVALATFSIAAWSVGTTNRNRVADLSVGAPTVLTVAPLPTDDLGAVVDRLDPGGHAAAAVQLFDSGTTTLIAAQPDRLASVAHWQAGFVDNARPLMAALDPSAPPPVTLDGERVRLHLDVEAMDPVGATLTLDTVATGATSPTPIDLGTIDSAHARLVRVGELSGCPCTLRDVQITPPGPAQTMQGDVTITGVDVSDNGGWHPVDAATDADRWTDQQDQQVVLENVADGLHWRFFATQGVPPTLLLHDRPEPLPAVVLDSLNPGDSTFTVSGLNAADVPIRAIGRARAIPGATTAGVVVDLTYATRAAYGDTLGATSQVWVSGPVDKIRQGIVDAGIPVLSTRTSAQARDELTRQGPGLASVLFLADAMAAAILAALAAVLSLYAAGRRRRYEYAALGATGASRRTLYAALATEQLVVIGFGAVVGVGAGLLATALAGHSVPQFVTEPAGTLLTYRPSVVLLLVTLLAGFVLLLAAAAAAAAALLRSVTPEQLREAPL